MEVLGSIYGEDMIRIPDLGSGPQQSAQASGELRDEFPGLSSYGNQLSTSEGEPLREPTQGLSAFLVSGQGLEWFSSWSHDRKPLLQAREFA